MTYLKEEFFKENPILYQYAHSLDEPGLFDNVIKDGDMVLTEPYMRYEYYNQECSLIEAYDLEINGDYNLKGKGPKLYFSKTEERDNEKNLNKIRKDYKSEDKPIIVFSKNTRFDFLISNKKTNCYLEVKNVTLTRNEKVAEFPDAVTSRGTKHLNELINAKKCGYQSYILYLIQREDCKSFKIADDIDKNYKIAFNKAIKAGVKVLCYDCKISNEELKLNDQINLIDYE